MNATGTRMAEVRAVLNEIYTPEGVEIWLDSTHVQLTHIAGPKTARELIEGGDGAHVLTLAESLRGQVAT